MSTYTSYALTGITNRETLLAAIATLDLQAQVYETAHRLTGFYDRDNGKKAHVVITKAEMRNHGIQSFVDVGFEAQKDGSYVCHTDGHYPTLVPGPDGDIKIEDAIQTAYARVNGDRALNLVLQKTLPRLKRLGKIPGHATVRKEALPNGSTRVLVSY